MYENHVALRIGHTGSLSALQCGSQCAAANPRARANPTDAATTGPRRWRVSASKRVLAWMAIVLAWRPGQKDDGATPDQAWSPRRRPTDAPAHGSDGGATPGKAIQQAGDLQHSLHGAAHALDEQLTAECPEPIGRADDDPEA